MRTVAPLTITPSATIELTATPVLPGVSWTNFAGWKVVGGGEERKSLAVDVESWRGLDQVEIGQPVLFQCPDVTPVVAIAGNRYQLLLAHAFVRDVLPLRELVEPGKVIGVHDHPLLEEERDDVLAEVGQVVGQRLPEAVGIEKVNAHRCQAIGSPWDGLGLLWLSPRTRRCARRRPPPSRRGFPSPPPPAAGHKRRSGWRPCRCDSSGASW